VRSWSIFEWNRKTIFEKLDWLKDTLEDVIANGNHNVSVHQKQMRDIITRPSDLEKPLQNLLPREKLVQRNPHLRRNLCR
jgi:hypothetical protein